MPLIRAADLIRSVGLSVDGPASWGQPVRSNKPGVYVIELPAPLASAPIDHNLLRAWIEKVPNLLLDGARPTPHELADRLNGFWFPDQTVLYIGRSNRGLGGRIAAYYQTPLGDPRPHAGGHWLKTLRDLPRRLVWWAETNAAEEAEDALMTAFAGAVDPAVVAKLHDPTVIIPFANLQTTAGLRKDHGMTGTLLAADAVPETSRIQRSDRPRAKPRAARAGVRRPGAGSAAGLSGDGRVRRAPKAAPSLPPPERVLLSAAGLEALQAELDELRTVQRPDVVRRISAARELGDLSENADYEIARHDQSFIEGRIRTVEDMIERASIIDQAPVGETVHFGSTVVLDRDGHQERFTIVGPTEANPREGRISHVSPIGQALLGKRVGDEVVVSSPAGQTSYKVVELA
jgi:transcription elongation factor GreA